MLFDQRHSLKALIGENAYAVLRAVYRGLHRLICFVLGFTPRQSQRRTVLEVSEDSLYLLYKDANDESQLIANRNYEEIIQRLMKHVVQPGDTVLDVGANCGLHTVLLSKLCGPDGSVHAFEPVDYSIKKLNANLHLNGCRNVLLHDCALGERTYRKQLRKIRETGYFKGNSSLVENEKLAAQLRADFELEEVQVRSLDEVVKQYELQVNLIKIDVEGYEYQVLQGARRTIAEQSPAMIMEYASDRLRHLGLSSNDFKQLLGPHYDAYSICGSNTFDRYDSLEPFDFDGQPCTGNLLLIPKYQRRERPAAVGSQFAMCLHRAAS